MTTKATQLQEFRQIKTMSGWRTQLRCDLDSDEFLSLCLSENKTGNGVFSKAVCSNSNVFRFTYRGEEYFFKEYIFRNVWKQRNVFYRGYHVARISRQLNEHGFLAPEVVCYGRRGKSVFVVSESAHAKCSIKDAYLDPRFLPDGDISAFRQAYGREVARLHHAGFFHGDLRWGNVLVRFEEGKHVFVFIDNDRSRRYRRLPSRLRVKNLAQIRLMTISMQRAEEEWDDFWKGYCEVYTDVRKNASAWMEKVRRKTEKRLKERRRKKNRHENSIC